MFCPKCGDGLVEIEGWLTCVRGNMALRHELAAKLEECLITRTRWPSDKPWPVGIGGRWFCPGCGTPAPEREKGVVRCQECGRSLNEFIYALVEIHPHEGTYS